jgi:hypothetical protein
MRARLALVIGVLVPLAPACESGGREAARRAEVERRVAEAEGAGAKAAPPPASVPPAITREAGSPAALAAGEPSPPQAAWSSAISRAIDGVEQRSRQMLSVHLLRAANDPRQKSQDLIGHMQWCDEGSLEACLHVGHVLLFNECLFDRARGYYEKAASLAQVLPPAAVDHFTVDGQPQRQELRIGLRLSDPSTPDDEQRRAIAAVCGIVAERDRPLWDDMFSRYASGEVTPAALPSSAQERLALGAIRKKTFIEVEERVAALEGLHAGAAQGLRLHLADTASRLCGEEPLSCAMAAFLLGGSCRMEEMQEAYGRFQAALSTLDAASRVQALELASDLSGPARAYAEADAPTRALLRRSICHGG